jgi:hypothetical protein
MFGDEAIYPKAFDPPNQMHSMIPEKTGSLLLNLFLYVEIFKIRNSTVGGWFFVWTIYIFFNWKYWFFFHVESWRKLSPLKKEKSSAS